MIHPTCYGANLWAMRLASDIICYATFASVILFLCLLYGFYICHASQLFYSQSVCHATFVHTYITFYISSILHVKRFIILHVIRFIWLHWSIWICRLFCIIQDTYVCHSRCKVTTKNPKNNGFQILWQHVADSCSGCLGCICSKGAILAVILHPKGKAMDTHPYRSEKN